MIIKETKKYSLYEGSSQSTGLYNLTEKATDKITYWFDDEIAEELIKASNKQFNKLASGHTYYK